MKTDYYQPRQHKQAHIEAQYSINESCEWSMAVNIAMGGIYSQHPCETSLGFSAGEVNFMKTDYYQPRLHKQAHIEAQYSMPQL